MYNKDLPFYSKPEAQKYAIYNKDLVHFGVRNMQIYNLHMGELPGA
jgi:hypothetical protein